jgi:TetR/AcrR family transcriptional regulator, mexJK operon transcriptional repressor
MRMRARKSDEVLVAARRIFLRRGFDAATVDEIAAEAGVSKATVYSNFHDKESLLAAMIDRVTSESATILAAVAEQRDDQGTVEERLRRMGSVLARGVLNPDVLRLRRLAVSTATAFPESSALYWQRGPAAAIAMLETRLAAMVDRGELALTDVAATAAQFAYAVLGPLQDRAMFEIAFAPDSAEVDRYLDNAVGQLLLASARR